MDKRLNVFAGVLFVILSAPYLRAEVAVMDTVFLRPRTGNGQNPTGVGVNPNTNEIYVANNRSENVSVIDGSIDSVIATKPMGDRTSLSSGDIIEDPWVLSRIAPETSPYEPTAGSLQPTQFLQDTLGSWDLRDTSQTGQLTIISTENDGGRRGFQVAVGDVNDDGYADLVVSGPYVSALGRTECGGAYIFYDLRDLSFTLRFASADVKIYGPSDNAAIQGLAVGDVNDDGVDDIVLGATGVDEIYLVLGSSSLDTIIDLDTSFDSRMSGIAGEVTGSSISLGDINADGMQDILIAAPYGDGPSGTRWNCGSYYLVYGRTVWTPSIDLINETIIYGANAEDGISSEGYYPGMQIVSGDINGDGFDDILIGAPGGDGRNNDLPDCGEAYAVFGDTALPDTIDLATQADLTCYGIDSYDHIARLGSGDVNGDGIDDFLIGARDADGRYNVLPDAGEIYVVYGRSDFPDTMEMGTQADVTICGAEEGDILGRMAAKDVNGDGVSDLLLGATAADGPDNTRNGCGEAYLLYGYGLPSVIELGTYPHYVIYGADADDHLTAYGALAFAEIDTDRVIDLIIGASVADGLGNSYYDAGEAYVVSGWHLTGYTVDVAVTKILAPSGEVPKDTTITPAAEVRNLGLGTETFPVIFQIGTAYSETVSVILASDEIDTIAFPAWTAVQLGTHATSCSTALADDENPTNDIKTGTVIVLTGEEPVILSVSPNSYGNIGLVNVNITGLHFQEGARVKLTKTGQPDIVADSLMTMIVDSANIIVRFDLTDKLPGLWNVVVTNPDSLSATFYDGFTIETGIMSLWLDIVGRDRIRVGRITPIRIRYGNYGNVDAHSFGLWIRWPSGLVLEDIDISEAREFSPDTIVMPDTSFEDSALCIVVNTIPAGAVQEFILYLRSDQTGRDTITLEAVIAPLFEKGALLGQPLQGWKFYPPEEEPLIGAVCVRLTAGVGFGHVGIYIGKYMGNRQVVEMTGKGNIRIRDIDVWWTKEEDGRYLGAGYPIGASQEVGLQIAALALSRIGEKKPFYVVPLPPNWWNCLKETKDVYKVAADIDLPWDPFSSPLGIYETMRKGWYPLPEDQVASWIFLPSVWKQFTYLFPPVAAVKFYMWFVGSIDPNDKVGSIGYDTTFHFVLPEQMLNYIVFFENVDSATADAENIWIVDTLDAKLDWSTLVIGDIYPDSADSIIRPDYNPQVEFDSLTGVITWTLADINLPPDTLPPNGEGWLSFSILPEEDLASGTQLFNRASIKFDENPWIYAPMDSSYIVNTIDALPPISMVLPLPDTISELEFEVIWSGADDSLGSGIRDYTVYVSDNGGPFTIWLPPTSDTFAAFTGESNHIYEFYSIAIDNVGNPESAPDSADATTFVEVGVEEGEAIPKVFSLSQNYPNPFLGKTTIKYAVPRKVNVSLKIYDISGRLVHTLINDPKEPGYYTVKWDAKDFPTGVYFARFVAHRGGQAGDFIKTKKLVLMR